MTDLASLVVRLQADISEYKKALDQAAAKLDEHAKHQDETLKHIAERIGEAFAVEKLVEFAASAIESAAALEKMSQSAGIGVEQLSALRLAAAASGISQDELGTAFKKLNVNISEAAGNAGSKAGVAFKLLAIDVRDADGHIKDAGVTFSELAAKFQGMEDGPNKTAIAVALLGKAGQNLIPVLNQGAAGLEEFKKKAADAGLVISKELAQSAEEFSQKANVLKASIIDGLGVQLATQLLPVLNSLVDAFEKGGHSGETLANIATAIVTAFKLVSAVVIISVTQIKAVGTAIGGVIHILDDLVDRDKTWAQVGGDIKETFGDAINTVKNGLNAIDGELNATAANAAKLKDAGTKTEAPNLAAGQAAETALKKLEQFRDTLKEQAEAFGLGSAALVKFKLETGSLAKDVEDAGEKGRIAAAKAIQWAEALERKKDSKTVEDYTAKIVEQITQFQRGGLAAEEYKLQTGSIGEALKRLGVTGEDARKTLTALSVELLKQKDEAPLQALTDQADRLAGNLNKAALAAFDLQNKALKQNLTDSGASGEVGLAQLAHAREYVDAQSQINELNLKAAQINSALASQESLINLERAQGHIGAIEAMRQEDDARQVAVGRLNEIYNAEKGIAAAVNDPALTDGVMKFAIQIDNLKLKTNQLEDSVRAGLESSFANNFADLITGAKTFQQAITGMLKDIEKQFADLVAKQYAEKLFGAAGGGSSGGSLGGLAGMLASLAGSASGGSAGSGIAATGAAATGTDLGALASTIGGFANGGTIPAGKVGVVGENGPELAYSGAKDMTIVPTASAGKSLNVTNHFTIQSANGQISRASQMQVAANAARSLGQANQRNNT